MRAIPKRQPDDKLWEYYWSMSIGASDSSDDVDMASSVDVEGASEVRSMTDCSESVWLVSLCTSG